MLTQQLPAMSHQCHVTNVSACIHESMFARKQIMQAHDQHMTSSMTEEAVQHAAVAAMHAGWCWSVVW